MSERANEQLTEAYLAAHRSPACRVPAAALAHLDAVSAMAVQSAVLQRLGDTVSIAKVTAPAGGMALAAPIIDSWVTTSGGTLTLNGRNLLGLEIEIAAVLKTDITLEVAQQGKEAVQRAIDHYVVGIELIGTRIDRHTDAGPFGPLSDFLLTAGYVIGTEEIAEPPNVDGLPIVLETSTGTSEIGSARYPFGGVIEPILAYACAPFDHFGGLRAGMTVTTGSLCPLIEMRSPGRVQLRLGDFADVSLFLA